MAEAIVYLSGEILGLYNKFVNDNYHGNSVLKKFIVGEGKAILGLNVFAQISLNSFLKKHYPNMEIPALVDIERARNRGTDIGSDGHVIAGLVLRDFEEPNSYYAKKIGEQTPADIGKPTVYWLKHMKIEESSKTANRLDIIVESNKALYAPSLTRHCRFNATDENGLPIEDANGKRYSYAGKSGLCELTLLGSLGIVSNDSNFELTYYDSKVMAVDRS